MNATTRALVLAGALVAAVIVAGVILAIVRRRIFRGDIDRAATGIPLHELRAMHARGELTDLEFEQLRAAALAEWGAKPGNSMATTANGAAESSGRQSDSPEID